MAKADTVSTPATAPQQATPSHLYQPATAPEAAVPDASALNPMFDRGTYEVTPPGEPTEPVEPVTDAHLEPTEEPDTDPDAVPDAPPATLADMVGAELMQDPGCSLVARGLDRLCKDKVDHNRAFGKALENDDSRFIDETYLRDVLGDDADEAIQSAKFLLEYADKYAADLTKQLYSGVEGGEEAVKIASKHFNTTASQADKDLVTKLLDSGNISYMQHAVRLITDSAKGVMPVHRQQTFGTPTGIQPMSRAEFGKAVLDNPNMTETEYTKIRERLAASFQ